MRFIFTVLAVPLVILLMVLLAHAFKDPAHAANAVSWLVWNFFNGLRIIGGWIGL